MEKRNGPLGIRTRLFLCAHWEPLPTKPPIQLGWLFSISGLSYGFKEICHAVSHFNKLGNKKTNRSVSFCPLPCCACAVPVCCFLPPSWCSSPTVHHGWTGATSSCSWRVVNFSCCRHPLWLVSLVAALWEFGASLGWSCSRRCPSRRRFPGTIPRL